MSKCSCRDKVHDVPACWQLQELAKITAWIWHKAGRDGMTCKSWGWAHSTKLICRRSVTFWSPPVRQQPSAEAAALQLSAAQLQALQTGSHTVTYLFVYSHCVT